jgi:hypothetical protein
MTQHQFIARLHDVDGSTIDSETIVRCHALLDKCDAPDVDDQGETLSLRFRLVALAYKLEPKLWETS